jgi:hypothetical protein
MARPINPVILRNPDGFSGAELFLSLTFEPAVTFAFGKMPTQHTYIPTYILPYHLIRFLWDVVILINEIYFSTFGIIIHSVDYNKQC